MGDSTQLLQFYLANLQLSLKTFLVCWVGNFLSGPYYASLVLLKKGPEIQVAPIVEIFVPSWKPGFEAWPTLALFVVDSCHRIKKQRQIISAGGCLKKKKS